MTSSHDAEGTKRRGLFSRLAGLMTLGAAAVAGAAEAATDKDDGPRWPGVLKGRHKQVVDGTAINNGTPLGYAHTFMATNPGPGAASAVIVLRSGATPIALKHEMWVKYKIGETLKIEDPETKATATKNPYFQPKPGVLVRDDIAIDRMIAAGAIIGACNVALTGLSKKLAPNAGVTPAEALKDLVANVVPGVTVIPAGTWGVNRAQEAGCTYCVGT
jgi:hypothetical protein